jgi:hypothetical protein
VEYFFLKKIIIHCAMVGYSTSLNLKLKIFFCMVNIRNSQGKKNSTLTKLVIKYLFITQIENSTQSRATQTPTLYACALAMMLSLLVGNSKKKWVILMASSGTIFTPSFIKVSHLVESRK